MERKTSRARVFCCCWVCFSRLVALLGESCNDRASCPLIYVCTLYIPLAMCPHSLVCPRPVKVPCAATWLLAVYFFPPSRICRCYAHTFIFVYLYMDMCKVLAGQMQVFASSATVYMMHVALPGSSVHLDDNRCCPRGSKILQRSDAEDSE